MVSIFVHSPEKLDHLLNKYPKSTVVQVVGHAHPPRYLKYNVHIVPLQNGTLPSHDIIKDFISITGKTKDPVIFYCDNCLGRPSLLAAIYLIESGLNNSEAINIATGNKSSRHLTSKQIDYLGDYEPLSSRKHWFPKWLPFLF